MMLEGITKFTFLHSVILLSLNLDICHSIIVKISNGLIEGETANTIPNGRPYYSFRSIPYAKPPLGELRFQAPQPIDNWKGVLPTKNDSARCVQSHENRTIGQEDCLFVNVYTPQEPYKTDNLLPVMVWIYGGAFMFGGSEYGDAAPDFFLDEGIVFVSLNYRVGILGFLSLNDLIAPGNNGLKDQNLALRWIRNNIRNFGGDPDRVTIFGQSAGSASVSYHLQSPLSAGLFRGAILNSGTSLSLWARSRMGSKAAEEVAKGLDIDTNSSQSIMSGLRKVEVMKLHKKAMEIQTNMLTLENPLDGFLFTPVMEPDHDGAFFSGKSYELLKEGNFSHVPVILGYNSLEVAVSIPDILRVFLMRYDLKPSDLVPADMNIKSSTMKDAVGKEIKYYYFKGLPVALSNVDQFLSDDQFVRPIQQFARLISRYSPTYFYEFNYEGNMGGISDRTQPGVAHTEELGYLFRRNITANERDSLMRSKMVKLWSNFVKFSNPTPERDELLENQIWPTLSPDSKDFDYFKLEFNLEPAVNPRQSQIDFWNGLYKKYGERPYDTY